MGQTMQGICDDLAAEKADLVEILGALDTAAWATPTPAEPWTVHDQVAHLAYFDEKALLAHQDPEAFLAQLNATNLTQMMATHLDAGAAMTPAELLAWWDEANSRLVAAYRDLDPKMRVVWYGPPMAARSKVTARIMETWAHGQDIVDGLGVTRTPSARLRHVCHIGVRARSYSYMANTLSIPAQEVRVELTAPTGELWTWGDAAASDRVAGDALGFALLVTQRRHRHDVDLVAEGAEADRWLDIAQAFAGPPGEGRQPGQFAGLDTR